MIIHMNLAEDSYDIVVERGILLKAKEYLNPEGKLLFEIGHDQGEAVSSLMKNWGFSDVKVIKDLSGNDRVVTGHL